MALTKTSVKVAMGLVPMDMVFYKDENDKLYRLRYLKSAIYETTDQIEILGRLMNVSKYATDIIEGEVVEDSPAELHIKAERGIYIFQKNAEKVKFWDVTDRFVEEKTHKMEMLPSPDSPEPGANKYLY